MLRALRIQNYAIVDDLSLTFSGGFNVMTGEAGAGKSILVDALSLLLGGRSRVEEIRAGAEEAVLEARFDSPSGAEADDASAPLPPQDNGIVLKRVLFKTGRGRSYLNGALVPLTSLKEVGQHRMEIHGQHAQYGLLDAAQQLVLLDMGGALCARRSAYATQYRQWMQLKGTLAELRRQADTRQTDFLYHQLTEIQGAQLQPDEEAALLKESLRLKNGETILSSVRQAYALLDEEGGILSQMDGVGRAILDLREASGEARSELGLWETARIHLKELSALLRAQRSEAQYDPVRLDAVSERLYLIQRLKKKYGPSYEDIFSFRERLEAEISSRADMEARQAELQADIAVVEAACHAEAQSLSTERAAVKTGLEKKMRTELSALGMEQTTFTIARYETALSETGVDRIVFQIALPGEAPLGLDQVASGGELSRIMLALKVVLAESDPVQTFIFDEIDAGVGGGIAERIGLRLLRLSQSHQVVCITHLPQIARFAQHHYVVQKTQTTRGDRIVTSVRELSAQERVTELARMLGGITMTPLTLRHAEEMIRTHPA